MVPEDFDCLRYLMLIHDNHCGRFDDYSLQHVKHLVHTCETQTPQEVVAFADKMVATCSAITQ